MEQWQLDQLDKLSDGDVALKIFECQAELNRLEQDRAQAAQRLSIIKAEVERAQREYRDACAEEREAQRDVTNLNNYLKLRMSKKEEN